MYTSKNANFTLLLLLWLPTLLCGFIHCWCSLSILQRLCTSIKVPSHVLWCPKWPQRFCSNFGLIRNEPVLPARFPLFVWVKVQYDLLWYDSGELPEPSLTSLENYSLTMHAWTRSLCGSSPQPHCNTSSTSCTLDSITSSQCSYFENRHFGAYTHCLTETPEVSFSKQVIDTAFQSSVYCCVWVLWSSYYNYQNNASKSENYDR